MHGSIAAVAAGTTIVLGTMSDCPGNIVDIGVTVLWVGYGPYDTLEEHRWIDHFPSI
jgi:hypothetical protein